MNRTRKAKIIGQLFGGETAMLQHLKSQRQASLSTLNYNLMTDEQLTEVIEAGTGKPCPNYESMTDEELDAIINART